MEYKVVVGFDRGDLEFRMAAKLADGWRPIGGVSHCPNGYMQAIIREQAVGLSYPR